MQFRKKLQAALHKQSDFHPTLKKISCYVARSNKRMAAKRRANILTLIFLVKEHRLVYHIKNILHFWHLQVHLKKSPNICRKIDAASWVWTGDKQVLMRLLFSGKATAIFDPLPPKSEIDKIWAYFESDCAYCGKQIERTPRTGHLDHLVPSAECGSNNIHNHALACDRCNGDEKREESWQSFLERKSEDAKILHPRKQKIDFWLSKAPPIVMSPKLFDDGLRFKPDLASTVVEQG